MKLLFREISGEAAAPAANELYIHPESLELQPRRDLAMLVFERGLACLRQGPGPIETIVVRADPTLDDLLAAIFAGELLAGRTLPAAAETFASYAALVREGLTPGKVSLEISMQGIFKAIRGAAGDDLTNPKSAERFAADWSRMARVILQAIARGEDPFTTSAFADVPDFARERAFLASDLAVFRQDVLRGEQWVVDFPDCPPGSKAVLLRRPKSLLYAQWSRSERDAEIGRPFVFLAVAEARAQWIFSTDPVQRLSLESLAAVLQAAEAANDSKHADQDPWFDGQPFAHTLIASPRGGTKLSDRDVIAIVRRWSHARPAGAARVRWKLPAAAAAIVIAVGLSIGFAEHWIGPKPGPTPIPIVTPGPVSPIRGDGKSTGASDFSATLSDAPGSSYALLFATKTYDAHAGGGKWSDLINPESDAGALGKLLGDQYGFVVKPFYDQNKLDILNTLRQWHSAEMYGQDSELLIYFSGHGYFDWDENCGYIVAKDSLYDGTPDARDQSCISLDELQQQLNKIPCRHVFLVLDTCFGGTIDYAVAMDGSNKGGDDVVTTIGRDQYIADKLKKKSRLFLASAGKTNAFDGLPGQHSPFAQKLLDFLTASGTNNGVATANTLYDNIAWLKGERPEFGPMTGSEGGDFLFIRKNP